MSRIYEALSGEFGGSTFVPSLDCKRLTGQLEKVRSLMADEQWRTLSEIVLVVGGSEAGVSARLRDLKKEQFGSFRVQKRNTGNGLWQYRVLPPG